MRILKNWQYLGVAALGVGLVIFASSFLFSPIFQFCGPNEFTHTNECAHYHFGPFIIYWIVGTLDGHNGFVTALATVFVAGFTWTLWQTSEATVAQTKAAGALAEKQFLLEGLQADILEKQKEIQRIQLLALHRPRLVVREVFWDGAKPPTVSFVLVNKGVDPAVIKECRLEFNRTDARPIIPEGENVLADMTALPGGGARVISADLENEQGDNPGITYAAWDMGLFESVLFQGVIIYGGEYGDAKYRLVFKRICAKGQSIFLRTENPDDEYGD
jgi:hypothetical protein